MVKKRRILYVDGYNIINNWSRLREIMLQIGLMAARDELIDMLSEYQELSGEEVILVFDAHLVKGVSGIPEQVKGIQVVYTVENETADSYIEKQSGALGRHDILRVASSDQLVQQTILQKGATRLSAHELFQYYEQLKSEMRRREQKRQMDKSVNPNINDQLAEQLADWQKKCEEQKK